MEEENMLKPSRSNFAMKHMHEIISFINERYNRCWSTLPVDEAVRKFEFDVPMFVYKLMACQEYEMPKFMANAIINMPSEHLKILMDDKAKSDAFGSLVQLLYFRTISEPTFKDVFKLVVDGSIDLSVEKVGEYLYKNDLFTSSQNVVGQIAKEVESEFPKQHSEFKAGNKKVLNFLVGQCMKKAKGKASAKDFIEFFAL